MVGPCDRAAIRPFGHHPGAFPVMHPQWLCFVGRCGLDNCLSSDSHLYVRGFGIPLVVRIPFHLHFLLKISLEQFFKVMFTRSYSNGKPGAELATGIHQISQSNFSGAMRCCSVGTKKSEYLLLENRSCQLAYLVQLLQYSHELLGLCIGLRIQRRLLLVAKAQVLAKVTEVLAVEWRAIVTAYRNWYAQ